MLKLAARLIRRIMVDQVRNQGAAKRGGFEADLGLDFEIRDDGIGHDLARLNDALEALEERDPEKVRIVELRYFVGFSREEIAEILGISAPTVTRHYQFARKWLFNRIRKDEK